MLGGWFERGGCVTKMGRRLTFVCLLRPDYEGVTFFFLVSPVVSGYVSHWCPGK